MLEGPTDGTQLTLDRMIALRAEVLSGGGSKRVPSALKRRVTPIWCWTCPTDAL